MFLREWVQSEREPAPVDLPRKLWGCEYGVEAGRGEKVTHGRCFG